MQVGPNVNTQHGGKIPGTSKTDAKKGAVSATLNEPAAAMPFSAGYAGNSSNGAKSGSIAASLQAESSNASKG